MRLCWLLPLTSALRVSFNIETSRRLVALQDFGSRGGSAVTEIMLTLPECNLNGTGLSSLCGWHTIDDLYLVVLDTEQLNNLTRTFSRTEANHGEADSEDCQQPSMVRALKRHPPLDLHELSRSELRLVRF